MHQRENCIAYYKRACRVIPGGVNSPVRSFSCLGIPPLVVKSAKGAEITDVDGNTFLDYCLSWGPLILGHSPEEILTALKEEIEKGISFGALYEEEVLFAEELITTIGFIDKVRLVNSGTEATMSALRLARGYTGKTLIVKFAGNYHGHCDALLVKAGSGVLELPQSTSKGISASEVQNTICLTFNDTEGFIHFMDHTSDVAAVIFEPVAGNMGVVPADPHFLHALREKTKEKKAVLIVDEVITGFRLGLKGACGLYSIKPDLVCYGKVIGGGFPMAAVAGRSAIMDKLAPLGGVYQAGTLSGNPMAVRMGREMLKAIKRRPHFYEQLEEKACFLLDPIDKFIEEHNLPISLQRVGSMFTFFFTDQKVQNHLDVEKCHKEDFTHFFLQLFNKGIYLSPAPFEACFLSLAHSKAQLEYTKETILEFLVNYSSKCVVESSH